MPGREDGGRRARRVTLRVAASSATQASTTIFLILRRMRAPLIVLIVIFSVSVLGLTSSPVRTTRVGPTTWASSTPSTS